MNCSGGKTEVFAHLKLSAWKVFWVVFSFWNSLGNPVGFFGNRDADEGVIAVSGELVAPARQELQFFLGGKPVLICKEAEVEPQGRNRTTN